MNFESMARNDLPHRTSETSWKGIRWIISVRQIGWVVSGEMEGEVPFG